MLGRTPQPAALTGLLRDFGPEAGWPQHQCVKCLVASTYPLKNIRVTWDDDICNYIYIHIYMYIYIYTCIYIYSQLNGKIWKIRAMFQTFPNHQAVWDCKICIFEKPFCIFFATHFSKKGNGLWLGLPSDQRKLGWNSTKMWRCFRIASHKMVQTTLQV